MFLENSTTLPSPYSVNLYLTFIPQLQALVVSSNLSRLGFFSSETKLGKQNIIMDIPLICVIQIQKGI